MSGIEIVHQYLVLPEGMELDDDELSTFALTVEWRGVQDETGRGGYAVTAGPRQLSRAGNWKLSVQPYQQRQYRWATFQEALEMARKHVETRKMNGRTWAEWQKVLASNVE